jgi:hypothetical protein
VEVETLHGYQFLQEVLAQLELVPAPVEFALTHRGIAEVSKILEVGMADCVMYCYPLVRREAEHLLKQVKSQRVCPGDLFLPLDG